MLLRARPDVLDALVGDLSTGLLATTQAAFDAAKPNSAPREAAATKLEEVKRCLDMLRVASKHAKEVGVLPQARRVMVHHAMADALTRLVAQMESLGEQAEAEAEATVAKAEAEAEAAAARGESNDDDGGGASSADAATTTTSAPEGASLTDEEKRAVLLRETRVAKLTALVKAALGVALQEVRGGVADRERSVIEEVARLLEEARADFAEAEAEGPEGQGEGGESRGAVLAWQEFALSRTQSKLVNPVGFFGKVEKKLLDTEARRAARANAPV